MNAYELADNLAFKHIDGDDSGVYIVKLQDMLRQQADRIAELEKDNEAFVKIASDEHKIAVEQEQRVLELEKELNHMRSFIGCGSSYYGTTSALINLTGQYKQMLATPQTKPLSDKEIVCNHGYNLKKLRCPKCEAGIEERHGIK